ncbi:MAG: HAD family hydrolase [Anaerolineae bacterium]|nr:HAD family hydrolase [Anaerolineae bacterium]
MALRAITFDFWGTLYWMPTDGTSRERRTKLLHRYLTEQGYAIPYERLRAALDESFRRAYEVWMQEMRTADTAERLRWILADIGATLPPQAFDALKRELEETLLSEPVTPIPGAIEVMRALAERYSLGLISDTGMTPGRVLRHFMARDGILDLFRHCTFSDETGRAKPHERQFLDTLNQLGARPEEAVHIGDLTATDITGARRVGMKAVLFTGVTQGQDPSQAHAVISSYKELLPILRAWSDS